VAKDTEGDHNHSEGDIPAFTSRESGYLVIKILRNKQRWTSAYLKVAELQLKLDEAVLLM
jgi:hypothetical protein